MVPALGLCYGFNYDHSEAFCGECVTIDVLRNFCHLSLVFIHSTVILLVI